MRLAVATGLATLAWSLAPSAWPWVWLLAAALTQALDNRAMRPLRLGGTVSPGRLRLALAVAAATTATYSSLTVYLWFTGGVAGQLIAILLACGGLLHVTVQSHHVRPLMLALGTPHAVYLLILPLLHGADTANLSQMSMVSLVACLFIFHLADATAQAERTAGEAGAADARLRQALDAMAEGLAFLCPDGRYVLWNAQYARLAFRNGGVISPGDRFEDVLRAGVRDGLYPEAAGCEDEWVAERLARMHAGGPHEQALADGRWLRIEERRTPDGGVLASLVDITELKQREESFRLLFSSNPVPMVVFDDATLAILDVNEAAVRQYGYDYSAFLSLRIYDLLRPEELPAAEDLRAVGGIKVYEGERSWRHRSADGRDLNVQPFMRSLDYAGRPAKLIALWDVTVREQAEAELRRTRQFLDTIVETMPAMLIVKNIAEGRYALLNRAGEALMGWRREDVLGRTAYDLVPQEEAAAIEARDNEVLRQSPLTHEGPLTTRHGVRHVRSTRVTMPGPDGRPEHMLHIVQDVTEAKAASDALAEARDAAEAANIAKSEFLANMSHEIRTPLNGVVGLLAALNYTSLDARQREMLAIMETSATVLERLLSDILDLARVESGRLEIEAAPFNLLGAIQSAAGLHRGKAEEKGLRLDLDVPASADVLVLGDAVRVAQIVGNLLSNAVKFTDAGGVTLRVRGEAADVWRIDVSDTGAGFSPEVKVRLFGRFEQADGSVTRRYGGSGLGLAISRSLAELMGGALDADSEPGRGSTFTLRLPLPQANAALRKAG